MAVVLSLLEQEGVVGELIRALRQGLYFGIETRVPYAITNAIRPTLFQKPSRPLFQQLVYYGNETLEHGWIIGRISVLFKSVELLLAKISGVTSPQPIHTFLAGCVAGYVIMVRDTNKLQLKKQINMAIGIRTLYALGAYLVRNDCLSMLGSGKAAYENGTKLWVTLMWGAVMWHWRHMSAVAPGEMAKAQVKSMDFIYNQGDKATGMGAWTGNNYLLWGSVCLLLQYFKK